MVKMLGLQYHRHKEVVQLPEEKKIREIVRMFDIYPTSHQVGFYTRSFYSGGVGRHT